MILKLIILTSIKRRGWQERYYNNLRKLQDETQEILHQPQLSAVGCLENSLIVHLNTSSFLPKSPSITIQLFAWQGPHSPYISFCRLFICHLFYLSWSGQQQGILLGFEQLWTNNLNKFLTFHERRTRKSDPPPSLFPLRVCKIPGSELETGECTFTYLWPTFMGIKYKLKISGMEFFLK